MSVIVNHHHSEDYVLFVNWPDGHDNTKTVIETNQHAVIKFDNKCTLMCHGLCQDPISITRKMRQTEFEKSQSNCYIGKQ